MHSTCPAHLIFLFITTNNIWRSVGLQTMPPIITQFSPVTRHFIPLRSKYSSQMESITKYIWAWFSLNIFISLISTNFARNMALFDVCKSLLRTSTRRVETIGHALTNCNNLTYYTVNKRLCDGTLNTCVP
jgi:hypothetical protein